MGVRRLSGGVAAVLALAALLVSAGAAHAVFPGQNGKIAYSNNGGDIWTVDPDAIWELGAVRIHDGSGEVFMTQGVSVP